MDFGTQFRVEPGSKPKLHDVDPDYHGKHESKEHAAAESAELLEHMRKLQYLLYADHGRSLLIVLQALDAGGKDGAISHVFSGVNPQGVRVARFGVPTAEELAHDFLWRIHKQTPGRGEVVIFNRSQYEGVLVERVQGLVPREVWSKRYDRINEFEENLVESGTCILKFYLHISPEEQLARFEKRLDDPMRRWKISEADYEQRKRWPSYIEAYEDVFRKTSTAHAPWYVIPANHKWFRNLAISTIVVDALQSMHLETPKPTVDLETIRKRFHEASTHRAA